MFLCNYLLLFTPLILTILLISRIQNLLNDVIIMIIIATIIIIISLTFLLIHFKFYSSFINFYLLIIVSLFKYLVIPLKKILTKIFFILILLIQNSCPIKLYLSIHSLLECTAIYYPNLQVYIIII